MWILTREWHVTYRNATQIHLHKQKKEERSGGQGQSPVREDATIEDSNPPRLSVSTPTDKICKGEKNTKGMGSRAKNM